MTPEYQIQTTGRAQESLCPLLLTLGSQNCAGNQDVASKSYSRPAVNPKIQVVQHRHLVEGGHLLFLKSLRNTEVTVEVYVQKNTEHKQNPDISLSNFATLL